MVSPISNSESTIFFSKYVLGYLSQLANWEKKTVLDQAGDTKLKRFMLIEFLSLTLFFYFNRSDINFFAHRRKTQKSARVSKKFYSETIKVKK